MMCAIASLPGYGAFNPQGPFRYGLKEQRNSVINQPPRCVKGSCVPEADDPLRRMRHAEQYEADQHGDANKQVPQDFQLLPLCGSII
jgi:hypothetical protein